MCVKNQREFGQRSSTISLVVSSEIVHSYLTLLYECWKELVRSRCFEHYTLLVFRRKSWCGLGNSPEDEQSKLFNKSRPHQLFSDPTPPHKRFTHGCSRKLIIYLFIVSSYILGMLLCSVLFRLIWSCIHIANTIVYRFPQSCMLHCLKAVDTISNYSK